MHYYSQDNIIYSHDRQKLICAAGTITNVEIPTTVTTIAEGAFVACTQATVTLPESIAQIEKLAFGYDEDSYCKLVRIKDGTQFERIKALVAGGEVNYPENRIEKY